VTDRLPIDVLTGDPRIRETIESGASLRDLAAECRGEIRTFAKEAAAHRLYRD